MRCISGNFGLAAKDIAELRAAVGDCKDDAGNVATDRQDAVPQGGQASAI